MTAGTLITIREGLEAFLIVGILLGYVARLNQPRFRLPIWIGAIAAALVSVAAALALQAIAFEFEGETEELFEAATAVAAVIVLTWMILWMQRQSRSIKSDLEARAAMAVSGGQGVALGALAFVSVLREGVETALFLTALAGSAADTRLLIGALIGLAIAGAITFLIFHFAVRLNLRAFFIVTGVLLILIAAGLLAHAVMELQEAGWIRLGTHVVWDLGWLLPKESWLGRLLHIFAGYEAAPTLAMVVVYLIYILVVGSRFIAASRGRPVFRPSV